MSLRDVNIRLRLDDSQFRAKIATAVANTRAFGNELEKSARKRQALNEVGTAFGKVGLAAGAAFGVAVKSAATFEQAMSKVKAALPDGAAGFDALSKAAIKAGQDTQFSATEAAQGVEALVKAGLSAKEVLGGGLSTALNIAASDSIDVATAADIAATAMNQFQLKGVKNIEHVADVLTGTANAAQGGVIDMAEAFKYVGPVAKTMGLSIDDTATAIGLLAKQGILGGEAGTNLRGVLISLTGSGKTTAKTLKELGLSATDFTNKKGDFIGLAGSFQKLRDVLADKGAAEQTRILARLFGRENIAAAQNFLDAGAKGFKTMDEAIRGQASAAEIAAIKMDNLAGDVEQLKGSLETALIGTGQGAQGGLRTLVQQLTDLVNAYNKLPPAAQSAVGGTSALVAGLGLTAFAATRVLTTVASTRAAVNDLGLKFNGAAARAIAFRGGVAIAGVALGEFIQQTEETNRTVGVLGGAVGGAAIGAMFGPWGAAIGGAAGAAKGFADANSAAKREVDDLTASLDTQTGAITENTKAKIAAKLEKSGALSAARRQGFNTSDLVSAIAGDKAQRDRINASIQAELQRRLAAQPSNAAAARGAEGRFTTSADYKDLILIARQLGIVSDETAKAMAQFDRLSEATRHLTTSQIDQVAAATRGIPRDVITEFHQKGAADAIDQAVKVARAAHLTPAQVTSVLKLLDYSTKDIDAVAKAIKDLDGTEAEVTVTAKVQGALDNISTVLTALQGIGGLAALGVGGGKVKTNTKNEAQGGAIYGPGTGTSDSIPARLSNGEHVLTASDVRKAGGQSAVYRMRAGIQSGALSFASGGAVMSNRERQLAIARLEAELAGYKSTLKTTKGKWPRRVLELEHAENLRALSRLKAGTEADQDLGLDALREAATAPVSLFDGVSDSPWMQRGGYASRAQQKLTQIRTLAGKLVQLRKAGLNGALLAEIYGLGSAQGIAAADELLRSPGEIKQLNAAYTGIQRYNAVVATAAYTPPTPVGKVRIFIEGFNVDIKKQTAHMRVVVRDEAGRMISEEAFNSAVR